MNATSSKGDKSVHGHALAQQTLKTLQTWCKIACNVDPLRGRFRVQNRPYWLVGTFSIAAIADHPETSNSSITSTTRS
jgi:hypothetical protein